jgi:NhaA family Na+:H+ antiporter
MSETGQEAAPPTSASPSQVVAHSWAETDRFIPRTVVRPLQRLMSFEVSTAALILVAVVVAMVCANSGLAGAYERLWETPVHLRVGDLDLVDMTLRDVVNDGLMTIFFFVVALEIKREWIYGELRDRRAAALPIIAALGGMVVPAIIYTAFNLGSDASHGWGIPMATDIAFAVAVVLAVGSRVPAAARLFLLTLAIVDDLGAIAVIAVFYTADLSLGWLAGAAVVLLVVWGLRRSRVRAVPVYVVLGIACWFMLHESGVHSTITGVAFAFLTPAWSLLDPAKYPPVARELVDEVDRRVADGILTHDEHELNHGTLREIGRLSNETQAPLDRMEFRLVPWSSFVVIPIFAFANGGLAVPSVPVETWLTDPVVLGVGLGLLAGKTLGVFGAAWLSARLGWAKLPDSMTYHHLLGVAVAAGVGFTVALFVADLAFASAELEELAKLGIMVGSVLAAVLGYVILRLAPRAG